MSEATQTSITSNRCGNVAPSFELLDLELIAATQIPGIMLRVAMGEEYAEEQVEALSAVLDATFGLSIAVLYREGAYIRVEAGESPQNGFSCLVPTVAAALELVRDLAPKRQIGRGGTRLRRPSCCT